MLLNKNKMTFTAFSTIAAATLFSSAAMAQIEANISLVNANNLVSNNDVVAKVSFTNTDSQPMQMLSYLMKANDGRNLEENIFTVTRDGKDVAYQGRHVKRGAPTAKDYVSIKPGQTVSFEVELSGVYDLSVAGEYAFQYNAVNLSLFNHQPMVNQKLATLGMDGVHSNVATTYIAGEYSPSDAFIRQASAKRCNPNKEDCTGGGGGTGSGLEFTGACSSGEQTSLISALGAARNMANDSLSSLSGSQGTRYATWFGAYSSARHNTVTGNFNAIKDALDNKPLTFDCSCNQSYYAYVYPNQPYKVYFCKAFWAANETGTDSRGGTIIHEISHFNATAGTDDIVYGQSGAKSLAISDPASAIQNADSHEYFAENTPRQN